MPLVFLLDVTPSSSNSCDGLEWPRLVMGLSVDHGPQPGDPFHGVKGVVGTSLDLLFVSPGSRLLGSSGLGHLAREPILLTLPHEISPQLSGGISKLDVSL